MIHTVALNADLSLSKMATERITEWNTVYCDGLVASAWDWDSEFRLCSNQQHFTHQSVRWWHRGKISHQMKRTLRLKTAVQNAGCVVQGKGLQRLRVTCGLGRCRP